MKIVGLYTYNYYKKSIHLREIAREADVNVKSVQLQPQKLERINVLSDNVTGELAQVITLVFVPAAVLPAVALVQSPEVSWYQAVFLFHPMCSPRI